MSYVCTQQSLQCAAVQVIFMCWRVSPTLTQAPVAVKGISVGFEHLVKRVYEPAQLMQSVAPSPEVPQSASSLPQEQEQEGG